MLSAYGCDLDTEEWYSCVFSYNCRSQSALPFLFLQGFKESKVAPHLSRKTYNYLWLFRNKNYVTRERKSYGFSFHAAN